MTLSEYFATPETVLPQELLAGVVRVADAPRVSHQRVVLKLALALENHVADQAAGEIVIAPVDVIFDEGRPLVLQPDLVFVSRERSDIVRDRIHGAPDLVIEVLSPLPRIGQLEERVRWFAEYGVREIWLYRQDRERLDVLTCRGGYVSGTVSFGLNAQIRSQILPFFIRTMASVLEA